MKIEWATHKAASYAVRYWHYSGRMPKGKLAKFGAWEDGAFVGVVLFGRGAIANLLTPYGLQQQEGCELVRVALRSHRAPVTQMIAISIRMLKKKWDRLRLVVSFADSNEGHHGGIYQGGNWIYTGKTAGCYFFRDRHGKVWHPRNVSEDLWRSAKMIRPSDCEKVWKDGKHRYLMPLDRDIQERVKVLARPYPKRGRSIDSDAPVQQVEGGANPTLPLQSESNVALEIVLQQQSVW